MWNFKLFLFLYRWIAKVQSKITEKETVIKTIASHKKKIEQLNKEVALYSQKLENVDQKIAIAKSKESFGGRLFGKKLQTKINIFIIF